MNRRANALLVAQFVLLLGMLAALLIVVTLAVQSSQNIQTLLLSGKTASAISAKKTAREVGSLTALVEGLQRVQSFDHTQTQIELRQQAQGNKVISQAIATIEAHLDRTIRSDALVIGQQVVKTVIPQLRKALK